MVQSMARMTMEKKRYGSAPHMKMGKKSHAPLFTLFVYFSRLVPPTGLFWTIFLPCHSSQFSFPAIEPNLLSCHFSQKNSLQMVITVWSKQKWKLRSPIALLDFHFYIKIENLFGKTHCLTNMRFKKFESCILLLKYQLVKCY